MPFEKILKKEAQLVSRDVLAIVPNTLCLFGKEGVRSNKLCRFPVNVSQAIFSLFQNTLQSSCFKFLLFGEADTGTDNILQTFNNLSQNRLQLSDRSLEEPHPFVQAVQNTLLHRIGYPQMAYVDCRRFLSDEIGRAHV